MEQMTEWRPVAVRRFGRPRFRWEGDVRVDPGRNVLVYTKWE
jgi:hypothetical protein